MKDISCPYCGKDQDINHDDGYGYQEGVIYNQQCGHCDKYFTFETSISFYYDVGKADCLNGGPHDFYAVVTVPKEYTMMRCRMCGEYREPTANEKMVHEIPEKQPNQVK